MRGIAIVNRPSVCLSVTLMYRGRMCWHWRIQELGLGGAHGERVERGAYNWGLGAEPPAGSRGRAPGRGSGGFVRGRSPLKLKAFKLSSIQWKRKNAWFSLLCNHNKLGYLRSEPKPNVPLGWGSRGAWPRKQKAFWDLGECALLGSATGPAAEPR